MTGVALNDLVGYLRDYLRVGEIPDEANAINGLQVEARGPIVRIIGAVDASQEAIDRVVSAAADVPGSTLLLVHHGLLWGGNQPITGRHYRRLASLLRHDIALYSAHVPLDVHPQVGNNPVLARRIGVEPQGSFGLYKGSPIGVWGTLPTTSRNELVTRLAAALGIKASEVRLIPGGPSEVRRVGVITGAGGNMVAAAREAGLDAFITGEGPHHSFFDAMEGGINLVYAGHYATETVGVQALGEHLASRFDLSFEFHHHPTGL
jgi:dinuclear metal center YbgI/SA1388 family protein